MCVCVCVCVYVCVCVCMTCGTRGLRLGAPAEQEMSSQTGTHGRAFAGGMWSPRQLERL